MPNPGTTYEVHDGAGRYWGDVCLKWVHDNTISGKLRSKSGFEEVKSIFTAHDEAMSADDPTDITHDNTGREIAQLDVVLVDKKSGHRESGGIVFVSSSMLFTCAYDQSEI